MSGENGLQACVFLRRDLFNTWCSLGESLNLPSHNHIAEFLFQSYAKKAEADKKCSQCGLLMPSRCSLCLEHEQLQQQPHRQHDQPQQHQQFQQALLQPHQDPYLHQQNINYGQRSENNSQQRENRRKQNCTQSSDLINISPDLLASVFSDPTVNLADVGNSINMSPDVSVSVSCERELSGNEGLKIGHSDHENPGDTEFDGVSLEMDCTECHSDSSQELQDASDSDTAETTSTVRVREISTSLLSKQDGSISGKGQAESSSDNNPTGTDSVKKQAAEATGKSEFICKKCNARFLTLQSLKIHLSLHAKVAIAVASPKEIVSEKSLAKSDGELVGRRTPRVMLTRIECLDKTLSSASSQKLSDKTSPSLFSASGISTEKQLKSSRSSRNLATETLPASSSQVAHLTELSPSTTSSRQQFENKTTENKNEDSDEEPSSAYGFSQECCCESEKSPLASSHLANSCETKNSESTPGEEFADVTGPPLASESSKVSQLKSSCQDLFTSSVKESSEENTINPTPTSGDKVKEQFECMDCGKYFAHKELLTKHIMTHTGEKLLNSEDPKKCKLCSKVFPFISKLQRHMQVHRSEKLECEDCGKCFKHKESLQKHTRAVHEGVRKLSRSEEEFADITAPPFASTSSAKEPSEENTSTPTPPSGDKELYECMDCGKYFAHKESLIRHIRAHKGGKLFSCAECGQEFTGYNTLLIHSFNHGVDKHHRCTYEGCGRIFLHSERLEKHVRLVHERKVYFNSENPRQCKICSKVFSNVSKIHRHMKTCQENNLKKELRSEEARTCKTCSKVFPSISKLHRHMQTHVSGKHFECKDCGKCFKCKETLQNHRRGVHEGVRKLFRCDECGKEFTWAVLKRHKFTHGGERPYKCTYDGCTSAFLNKTDLDRHHMVHAGLRLYKCDLCDKDFTHSSHLNRHKKSVHEGLRPFVCDKCQKSFATRIQMIRHALVHTDDKPHECTACEKRFKTKLELKRHALVHTDDKPFECTACEKHFKTKLHLKQHVKYNHGEQKWIYECTTCEKQFKMKKLLNEHVKRMHSGRKWTCDICECEFSQQKNLHRHKKTHDKIQPFPCDQCTLTFNMKNKLSEHRLAKHSVGESVKSFSCQTCGKEFNRNHLLQRHVSHMQSGTCH